MTRWLTEHEQELWRGWIAASMLLPDRLSRDLQEQHHLTGTDYQILVELSESPDRRMRMSTLADHTLLSRSRLSHQIDRMSKAGLVERQTCPDDGRGMYAVMTDLGWRTIVSAAPDHVESVRTHLLDKLTPEEFEAFGQACLKVADALRHCSGSSPGWDASGSLAASAAELAEAEPVVGAVPSSVSAD